MRSIGLCMYRVHHGAVDELFTCCFSPFFFFTFDSSACYVFSLSRKDWLICYRLSNFVTAVCSCVREAMLLMNCVFVSCNCSIRLPENVAAVMITSTNHKTTVGVLCGRHGIEYLRAALVHMVWNDRGKAGICEREEYIKQRVVFYASHLQEGGFLEANSTFDLFVYSLSRLNLWFENIDLAL